VYLANVHGCYWSDQSMGSDFAAHVGDQRIFKRPL
jgi:hypothetical protein